VPTPKPQAALEQNQRRRAPNQLTNLAADHKFSKIQAAAATPHAPLSRDHSASYVALWTWVLVTHCGTAAYVGGV
jgi:hypothetical protein